MKENGVIYRARIVLIEMGKILPFAVCATVALSFAEDLFSLYLQGFVTYNESVVLNKPISWFIGGYFEYNLLSLAILTIISYAIETCNWNKLAIIFLALQLAEKNYFADIELYEEAIYAIALINLFVSGFFAYKGMQILTKTNRIYGRFNARISK